MTSTHPVQDQAGLEVAPPPYDGTYSNLELQPLGLSLPERYHNSRNANFHTDPEVLIGTYPESGSQPQPQPQRFIKQAQPKPTRAAIAESAASMAQLKKRQRKGKIQTIFCLLLMVGFLVVGGIIAGVLSYNANN
ncbi:Protein of unknown function [Pyronema omphalodes CBS 100304]|uniref:Uncharacterized protein n=1 Tax=Pyronema omphalodes (strain CBS 100304) TaxID=1076935 RepID=U4LAE4_PYROM|nr:Protein of unknown function [Pyronema omphalodes CBS 100304]